MQISTRLSKEFNCLKEGTNIIKFKSKGRPPSKDTGKLHLLAVQCSYYCFRHILLHAMGR